MSNNCIRLNGCWNCHSSIQSSGDRCMICQQPVTHTGSNSYNEQAHREQERQKQEYKEQQMQEQQKQIMMYNCKCEIDPTPQKPSIRLTVDWKDSIFLKGEIWKSFTCYENGRNNAENNIYSHQIIHEHHISNFGKHIYINLLQHYHADVASYHNKQNIKFIDYKCKISNNVWSTIVMEKINGGNFNLHDTMNRIITEQEHRKQKRQKQEYQKQEEQKKQEYYHNKNQKYNTTGNVVETNMIYKLLSSICHPDKCKKDWASSIMIIINNAKDENNLYVLRKIYAHWIKNETFDNCTINTFA
jgi:hypothetical protein